MSILDEIAKYTYNRVEENKRIKPLNDIKQEALAMSKGNFEFERALKKDGLSFICECKKASPSKGIIVKDFLYLKIAKEYETAGGDCISVLTEPKWFLGADKYLKEIANEVKIPCLRKDFVVDEYMIYESKILGAKAVLLICAILSDENIKKYIKICDELGISALVEAHDENEIKKALNAGARIIGVNNRNLNNFQVDTSNSMKLRQLVPKDIIFVSESGVKTAEDIKNIYDMGADAVLVGETLVMADNKKEKLNYLKQLL